MNPRRRVDVRALALLALVVPVAVLGLVLAAPRSDGPDAADGSGHPDASTPGTRASGGTAPGAGGSPASSAPGAGASAASASASSADPSVSASPAGTPSLADVGRIANVADGWAISLPDGWLRVDPTAAGVARAQAVSPAVGRFLAGQLRGLARSGVDLVAIDPRNAAGDGGSDLARVYLARASDGGPIGLAEVAGQTIDRIKASSTVRGPVTAISITLPAGDAVKIAYRTADLAESTPAAPSGSAGGPATGAPAEDAGESAIVQYLVNTQHGLYVMTAGSRAEAAARLAPVFDAIARSLEVTK